MTDWYENRRELEPDQVFKTINGSLVKLDRRVPGDGTQWYVAEWSDYANAWLHEDAIIEPGDLEERAENP